MEKYIYYEPNYNRYTIINEDYFIGIARKNKLYYSTSFLSASTVWIKTTSEGCDGNVDEETLKEEINNPNHKNYKYLSGKLPIIEKLTLLKTDSSGFPYLIGDKNDRNIVAATYEHDGILATQDYHEAADAIYFNQSCIFKIPSDIKDVTAWRKYLIKKIKIRISIIKKQIT